MRFHLTIAIFTILLLMVCINAVDNDNKRKRKNTDVIKSQYKGVSHYKRVINYYCGTVIIGGKKISCGRYHRKKEDAMKAVHAVCIEKGTEEDNFQKLISTADVYTTEYITERWRAEFQKNKVIYRVGIFDSERLAAVEINKKCRELGFDPWNEIDGVPGATYQDGQLIFKDEKINESAKYIDIGEKIVMDRRKGNRKWYAKNSQHRKEQNKDYYRRLETQFVNQDNNMNVPSEDLMKKEIDGINMSNINSIQRSKYNGVYWRITNMKFWYGRVFVGLKEAHGTREYKKIEDAARAQNEICRNLRIPDIYPEHFFDGNYEDEKKFKNIYSKHRLKKLWCTHFTHPDTQETHSVGIFDCERDAINAINDECGRLKIPLLNPNFRRQKGYYLTNKMLLSFGEEAISQRLNTSEDKNQKKKNEKLIKKEVEETENENPNTMYTQKKYNKNLIKKEVEEAKHKSAGLKFPKLNHKSKLIKKEVLRSQTEEAENENLSTTTYCTTLSSPKDFGDNIKEEIFSFHGEREQDSEETIVYSVSEIIEKNSENKIERNIDFSDWASFDDELMNDFVQNECEENREWMLQWDKICQGMSMGRRQRF